MTPNVVVMLVVGGALVLLLGSAAVSTYVMDKREWNGGVSPSGKRWRYVATDSAGVRGYTDDAGNTCWITWSCVDRAYRHPMRRTGDRWPR